MRHRPITLAQTTAVQLSLISLSDIFLRCVGTSPWQVCISVLIQSPVVTLALYIVEFSFLFPQWWDSNLLMLGKYYATELYSKFLTFFFNRFPRAVPASFELLTLLLLPPLFWDYLCYIFASLTLQSWAYATFSSPAVSLLLLHFLWSDINVWRVTHDLSAC